MKLKEVSVSVKLTRNFDSHMVTETWIVDDDEEVDTKKLIRDLEEKVEEYLSEQAIEKAMK